jgi:hypothetical protein
MANEERIPGNANDTASSPAKKLKAGQIRIAMEDEEILWMDRKRKTLFALPWSFTKYSLTPSRLFIQTGLFTAREDEIRLYRIKDISYTQSLGERLGGTGTLRIVSSDASMPDILLEHIKNAKKVKAVLSQAVEVSRRENGVRTSEVVGGGIPPVPGNAASLGPEMVPDANGNGIDDRLE